MNNIKPSQKYFVPRVWGKPSEPIKPGSRNKGVGLDQRVRELGEFNDPRFNFSSDVIQKAPRRSGLFGWFKSSKKKSSFEYVNIRIPPVQEKPALNIAIKVSDLTEKLFLSEKAIKDAHSKHQLRDLLVSIREKYEEVIKNYEKKHKELVSKKSGESTGFTAQELMKAISTALTTPISPQGTVIRLGQNEVVAYEKKGKLRFVSLQKRIKLGEGSYSTVSKVLSLKGTCKVLKTAKKGVVGASEDIENANKNLTRLHSLSKGGEPPRGIQKPPHTVFEITGESTGDEVGSIDAIYDQDMSKFNLRTLSHEQKMDACYQLLSGLLFMKNAGFKHGDIKHSNILIKEKKDGSYLVHHADFGGGRFYSDKKKELDFKDTGTFTKYFLPINDVIAMDHCIKTNNKSAFQIVSDASDLFATAVCLYYLLTNKKYPFKQYRTGKKKGFANIQGGLAVKPLRDAGCSTDLIDLLKTAMKPNPLDRITPQSALDELNEIIKNEYPKLDEKLGLVKKTGEKVETINVSDFTIL